jgi:hypothetical protein
LRCVDSKASFPATFLQAYGRVTTGESSWLEQAITPSSVAFDTPFVRASLVVILFSAKVGGAFMDRFRQPALLGGG